MNVRGPLLHEVNDKTDHNIHWNKSTTELFLNLYFGHRYGA